MRAAVSANDAAGSATIVPATPTKPTPTPTDLATKRMAAKPTAVVLDAEALTLAKSAGLMDPGKTNDEAPDAPKAISSPLLPLGSRVGSR